MIHCRISFKDTAYPRICVSDTRIAVSDFGKCRISASLALTKSEVLTLRALALIKAKAKLGCSCLAKAHAQNCHRSFTSKNVAC